MRGLGWETEKRASGQTSRRSREGREKRLFLPAEPCRAGDALPHSQSSVRPGCCPGGASPKPRGLTPRGIPKATGTDPTEHPKSSGYQR